MADLTPRIETPPGNLSRAGRSAGEAPTQAQAPPAPTSRPSSRRSGATPVLVGSEPREEALTDPIRRGTRAKAVIAVHLDGQPADMDAITESCARHEVPLIEDAAESLGATHKGRHTGTIGRFGWSCAGELKASSHSARGLE